MIPRFIRDLISHTSPTIFGDGESSRDFCYVDNVVQANLLASLADKEKVANKVFNVAFGQRTTLNELFNLSRGIVARQAEDSKALSVQPHYGPFRPGDIKHSHADVSLAKQALGYAPQIDIHKGLELLIDWTLKGNS